MARIIVREEVCKGCEMCVNSHEESVRQHGGSEQRIFEAVRLAAIIRSFVVVLS